MEQQWFTCFDERLWLSLLNDGTVDVEFLQSALALRPGMRLLDAPCGNGRISLPLARRGIAITGVDLRPEHITGAQERFAADGLSAELAVMDLRAMAFTEEFDVAINWGGSFGYGTDKENADIVRRMAAAVKPGGRVLIDQPNREYLRRHFLPVMQHDRLTIHSQWNGATQRVDSTWVLPDTTCTSSIRVYTPGQMRMLFTQAGLIWEIAYGDKQGTPYRRGAARMIAVARKPLSPDQ